MCGGGGRVEIEVTGVVVVVVVARHVNINQVWYNDVVIMAISQKLGGYQVMIIYDIIMAKWKFWQIWKY